MSNRPKPIRSPQKRIMTLLLLAVLVFLYIDSVVHTEADFVELWESLPNMGPLFSEFWPPDLTYFQTILDPMLETVRMAIVGTTFGALLAIPIILLASRNVTQNATLVMLARSILNVVRTLPELLMASIFVAVFGLGPFAGMLALTIFSFGIIAKLCYESVETIDPGPLEAMNAVGANKLQFIGYAVVPQSLPSFVAYVLYTFEVCVRASSILGYVGAGGIGIVLKTNLDNYRYENVMSIIVFTLIIVVVIDWISSTIREKLL